MYARINASKNLHYILNYNEQKVTHKVAQVIHSSGFLRNAEQLDFKAKADRFQRLNTLNDRVAVNMLHISLNFHPSDTLSKNQLRDISDKYMNGLGFKDQPYLVYQHNDVGHPHLHIITNRIRPDGKAISIHNIGIKKSLSIRKKIEREYKLVNARNQYRHTKYPDPTPATVQKINYNDSRETKQSMVEVLQVVNKYYRFTNLQEYNAILRQYNLFADTGGKNSNMFRHAGLAYRVLNEHGNKVGIPIKASHIYFKPTLANLQKKFSENQKTRDQVLSGIRQKINWVLFQEPASLGEFMQDLQKEGIELVVRQNNQAEIYDLTYVDNTQRAAVNAHSMGKDYTIQGIMQNIQSLGQKQTQPAEVKELQPSQSTQHDKRQDQASPQKITQSLTQGYSTKVPQMLTHLIQPDLQPSQAPDQLRQQHQIQQSRRR